MGKSSLWMGLLIAAALVLFFSLRRLVEHHAGPVEPELIAKPSVETNTGRGSTRAFYTAPPTIPHALESQSSADCLRCHLEVTRLEDGRVATQTPHPHFTSCLQCHVSQLPSLPDDPPLVESLWIGLTEPRRGERWFWTSPPTIPHRLFLRENCLSCHGPQNPDTALRTTHPERTQCLQCHVVDLENEF